VVDVKFMKIKNLLRMMAFAILSCVANAQVPVTGLGESIVVIKNNRLFAVDLETTVFKPEGDGPFPVVIINHGKNLGNNRLQGRERAIVATRQFLQRGYAVVLPMRQGFSKSGGAAVGEGCNIAGNGEAQADDVHAVMKWVVQQSWVDAQKMIMLGQSHGGLTTLAYAQDPYPGIKFVVNFAGGLKYTQGCQWELALKDAFKAYGQNVKVDSLWFYGANDSFFPPEVIKPAHQAYVEAGGKAELIAFGAFGADAHGMFASSDGLAIWWPSVEAKLRQHGLPTALIFPQYSLAGKTPKPAPTQWADLKAIDQIPHLREGGRKGYGTFLEKPLPRAFALSASGAWGWAYGGDDPLASAMSNCQKNSKSPCLLYAVDEYVVWKP
jgi:dienelactone hydrolase